MDAAALSPRLTGAIQPLEVEVMRCRGGLRRWQPWRRRSRHASWWLLVAKAFSAQARIVPMSTAASQPRQSLRSGQDAKAWTLCATTSRATWTLLCTTLVPNRGGRAPGTKRVTVRIKSSTRMSSCSTSGYLHTRPPGSASQSSWSRSPRRLHRLLTPTIIRLGAYDSKTS